MNILRNQQFDTQAVRTLLAPIDVKYPCGFIWLDKRLDDIADGRADLWQLTSGGILAALAIVTPKGRHQSKLSTFIVAEHIRNRGVGRQLLAQLTWHWLENNIDSVHVTVDESDLETGSFFSRNGFHPMEASSVSYGHERRDKVFRWKSADFGL